MPSVYRIRNTRDGRVYIGQAVKFEKRKARHLWELRTGRHQNLHLLRAWVKFGENAFVFEIITDGLDASELTDEEQRQIDAHRATDPEYGYNKAPAAGTNLGVRYSDEARARMSAAQKGRTFTDEARQRIAATLRGHVQSETTKAKRNETLRGIERTPEWRAAIRDAHIARSGVLPLTAFGKTQHINDWAKEYGIDAGTLRNRLKRSGMPLEAALLAPSHRGRRKDHLGPIEILAA